MTQDNPSAFPCSPGDVPFWNPGMTLRDYFAGQALASVMSGAHNLGASTLAERAEQFGMIAEWMYQMADAMLAARQSNDMEGETSRG
jgi:hypothetical protein